MSDFSFLRNKVSGKWVISAPHRAQRTNVANDAAICPFCLGEEKNDHEVYRVGGEKGDTDWKIRVKQNKFPFTEHHEVIIHSPDHHKNFDELPFSQVELILQTYRQRYNFHMNQRPSLPAGRQVYIFHNRGRAAGESIPHPHSQLTVIPKNVKLDIPPLSSVIASGAKQSRWGLLRRSTPRNDVTIETEQFNLFCPRTSEWPDEVWIAPHDSGKYFGEINEEQITDLAFVLSRVIQILDLRHGHEFPFNFYIYPGKQWYLRLIPRLKILGGFELGTGIMVNTQEPEKTMAFLKEHFWEPDHEKIRTEHQADYWKRV